MTYTSDIILYNEIKEGNYESFRIIYLKYAESLINYASYRLESLDDAHDIVQDLFVVLWEKRDDILINDSFKAYLYAALNKRLLNFYRKNSNRLKYEEYIAYMKQSYLFGPDKYLMAKEIKENIDTSINSLSPKLKEIYLLSQAQYLSNLEIAKLLNISEQTVKNQLSTAKKILREKLKDHYLLSAFYLLIEMY